MPSINKKKNHLIISKNIKYIYIFTNEIKIFQWLNYFINFYKYVILFLIT